MFISKITICNLFAYYGEVIVEFKKQEGKIFIVSMVIMALAKQVLSGVQSYYF